MELNCGEIRVRDFERKDADNLYRIVREKQIAHFMQDWSQEIVTDSNYYEHVDSMQAQKGSIDFVKDKRKVSFAVALTETDEMIGMVAVAYKSELDETEVAYFISEPYLRRGYATTALNALVAWCFQTFSKAELPYLILTANSTNAPSNGLAKKCGFTLFEKRIPMDREEQEMPDDTYFYYRRYRD